MNVFLLHRYLIRINAHLDILWKTLDQILLSWIFIYFNLKVGLGKAKWLIRIRSEILWTKEEVDAQVSLSGLLT